MDNLIIFGAGASLGKPNSSYFKYNGVVREKSPPLGKDLYEELSIFSPNPWGILPVEYANMFRNDFEQAMIHASQEASINLALLQRAMAAYFFSFYSGQSSLYVNLARHISNSGWSGSIVTLKEVSSTFMTGFLSNCSSAAASHASSA